MPRDEKDRIKRIEAPHADGVDVGAEALGLTGEKYDNKGAVALDIGAKNAELGSTALKLASDGRAS